MYAKWTCTTAWVCLIKSSTMRATSRINATFRNSQINRASCLMWHRKPSLRWYSSSSGWFPNIKRKCNFKLNFNFQNNKINNNKNKCPPLSCSAANCRKSAKSLRSCSCWAVLFVSRSWLTSLRFSQLNQYLMRMNKQLNHKNKQGSYWQWTATR